MIYLLKRSCIIYLLKRSYMIYLLKRSCMIYLLKRSCMIYLLKRSYMIYLLKRSCMFSFQIASIHLVASFQHPVSYSQQQSRKIIGVVSVVMRGCWPLYCCCRSRIGRHGRMLAVLLSMPIAAKTYSFARTAGVLQ